MQKIQQGKTGAFDELYRRYSQRLLLYFFRMLGRDENKAQDFLQDLFVKVIEKNHLFRPGARFSTWIFTVAHNLCKNEYRRMEVRKIMEYGVDPDTLPILSGNEFLQLEKKMDFDRLKELMEKALEGLDENQRSTFILRFQEQLSVKEISEILGCSEGTTKSRLFYVTKKFAQKFKVYDPQTYEVLNHALK
jgi:RNA polymerase sigma-70 factor (ECF subfamily)